MAELVAHAGRLVLPRVRVVHLVDEGGEPVGQQRRVGVRGNAGRAVRRGFRPGEFAKTVEPQPALLGRLPAWRGGPPGRGERLGRIHVAVHPAQRPARQGRGQAFGDVGGDGAEQQWMRRRVQEGPADHASLAGPPAKQRAGRRTAASAGAGRQGVHCPVHPQLLAHGEHHGVPGPLARQVLAGRREELGHVAGRLPAHARHRDTQATARASGFALNQARNSESELGTPNTEISLSGHARTTEKDSLFVEKKHPISCGISTIMTLAAGHGRIDVDLQAIPPFALERNWRRPGEPAVAAMP